MSSRQVGLFLIPVAHLTEMHELAAATNEAHQTLADDVLYRTGQLYLAAQNRATMSVLRDGDQSWQTIHALAEWLQKRFFDGVRFDVLDPPGLTTLKTGLPRVGFAALERWVNRRHRKYAGADKVMLRELFDGLQDLLQSADDGHQFGLVIHYFSEECREPPEEPEPYTPGPDMHPEDLARFQSILQGIFRRSRARSVKGWPRIPGDGRMLLGLLAPEHGARWRAAWMTAHKPFETSRYVLAWQQVADFVNALEPQLEEPTVLTRAGPVKAHTWLQVFLTPKPEIREWQEVIGPDYIGPLAQQLDRLVADQGGEDGLVEHIWKMESYWQRKIVRAAYRQIRDYLDRAMERGAWLVWMHDKYNHAPGTPLEEE